MKDLQKQIEDLSPTSARQAIKKQIEYAIPTKGEFFDMPSLQEKTVFNDIDWEMQNFKKSIDRSKIESMKQINYLQSKVLYLEQRVVASEAKKSEMTDF